eukprot:TCONS_00000263-protein
MAPISLKKGAVDILAGELIMHILQIERKSENFKISMEYVMSNFRFNRFLDVNSLDVSRSLTGLCSKFRVNSFDKKADYLEKKVEEFINLPLLEIDEKDNREVQTDAHYALLAFLMKLSNNPLNCEFKPKEEPKPVKEENTFNWTKYLLLGEEPLEIGANIDSDLEDDLYDSDNEIWQLSEDEDSAEDDEAQHLYDEVSEIQKQLKKFTEVNQYVEEKDWLREKVVPAYWIESEKSTFPFHVQGMKYINSNNQMCNNWELYKNQFTKVSNDPQLLSEKILVRETVWMLLGLENLHVYKFTGTKYDVNEDIVITHLTKETLSKFLTSFTEVGTKVVLLKRFTELCAQKYSEIPKTIQAFGYTISKYLSNRRETLIDLEKTLMEKDNATTLLTLKDDLADDISKVNFIYKIYNHAVVEGHEKYFTVTERVVHFLDVFYDFVCTLDNMGDSGTEKMMLVLPMFLEVCRPYLEDVGCWMATGQLPRDEEFMIYRTQNQVQGETRYWHELFLIRENRSTDGKSSKLVPRFLEKLQKQILVSGKSLGLLEEFVEFTSTVVATDSLYEEFKRSLKINIQKSNERYRHTHALDSTDHIPGDAVSEYISDSGIDPLLRANFHIMFNNVYQRMKTNKEQIAVESGKEEIQDLAILLRDCSCRPPMKRIIDQSLSPVVLGRYGKACVVLLELFKKEMKFLDHLAVMKNFFLMQATGEMYEFYTDIFEKAKHGRYWRDMSYLNIVLQDALQVNYPKLMGNLTVDYYSSKNNLSNAQLFDGLSLHYKVPWPVSIVLDQHAEDKYNEVFRFLFKVKRAIWVLEQLRFQELVYQCSDSQDHSDSEDEGIDYNTTTSTTRRGLKQHVLKDMILSGAHQKLKNRILVLRMKMLHVVRSFHFYLMTRIDDSIHQEFRVESARDLDEILEFHQKFLFSLRQRCFLHEKVARTKDALVRILNLSFELEELWRSSVAVLNVNQLMALEKEFFRCTSFLHSFFTTLSKRGSFPHFEFLATTMKFESR